MSRRGIIAAEEDQECELCGAFEECRPYGPKGEQVCFDCGMKDEATTKQRMMKHIFGDTLQ